MSEELYFRSHIFVCTNSRAAGHPRGSCATAGSEALRNYLKVRVGELGLQGVRVNNAGCLDRCGAGPVLVIYPEGVWYSFHSEADLDEILEGHVIGGRRVERLVVPPGVR